MINLYNIALDDIRQGVKRLSLVSLLGWHDVRQRYRRSTLGPLWLTLSMGVLIGTIAVVFGQIFKTPLNVFLPFLTMGVMLWTFISTTINDGCASFISASGIIRELPLPLFIHSMRVIWRNTLILIHNFLIFVVVLLVFRKSLPISSLLSVVGFVLLIVNLSWMTLFLGIICTRFRDLPQVINSVLQVFFYLTPVMWLPSQLPSKANMYLIAANPFFHLLQIVRGPLLGEPWVQSGYICALIALCGWGGTLLFYGRYKHRVAYWL